MEPGSKKELGNLDEQTEVEKITAAVLIILKSGQKNESSLWEALKKLLPKTDLYRYITKEEAKKANGHYSEECCIGNFAIDFLLGNQIKIDWKSEGAVFSLLNSSRHDN